MPLRIGVIGLVPVREFTRFVGELRSRYPKTAVTAVIGSPELQVDGAADEYLLWGSLSVQALVREIRQRRFDLLAVPYNREYTHTLTYWKALALALVSGTRGLLFCEQARLPKSADSLPALGRPRALAGAALSAAWRMVVYPVAYLAREAAILALSSPLLLVLLGIVAVDLADWAAGAMAPRGRNCLRPR